MVSPEDVPADRPEPTAVNPALEFAAILGRRKWTILGVFIIVSALATFGAVRTPPSFRAESSLLVRMGREYIYRSEVGRTETARTPSLSEIVNSEVEILSSRDLAELVVEALGVERLYPKLAELGLGPDLAREKAVLRLRQSTTVRAVLESSVIKLGFEHEDPALAAEVVNLLVERFRDKHLEVFGEERSGTLQDQLETQQVQLARAEDALSAFKRDNGVFDLDEQRSLLLGQRVRLEDDLRDCELQLVGLRLQVDASGQAEPTPAPLLPAHLRPEMKGELLRQLHELERELRALEAPVADRLIEAASLRLLDLQLEESKLLRDFSPENRRVLSVRAELETVREFLREAQIRSGASDEARRREREAGREELQARITSLTADIELLVREEERQAAEAMRQRLKSLEIQRETLSRELADMDQRIRDLEEQEKVLRQLERRRVSAESAVQRVRERVDDARLAEELDREKRISVRVIEKAAAPVVPSGLSRNLKIALGAFVGLLAGAALAVLQELFRAR
jgi:uncharacterized protein involved in exopolysaccharide biosynthesis